MTRRLIDLSVPLQNTVYADPPGLGPNIEYIDHEQSVGEILKFFPGLTKEDLPDGKGGPSSAFICRRTTGRISMRHGTIIRR